MTDTNIVDFPTAESALAAVARFAQANKMQPADLIDVLQVGVFAHRGRLIDAEDRRPELVEESIVISIGRAVPSVDWDRAAALLQNR